MSLKLRSGNARVQAFGVTNLALLGCLALGLASTSIPAQAVEFDTWLHGTSLMGDVKYPKGFKHFDYVNPDAPKGGIARQAVAGGFDNFNAIIPKGDPAAGLGNIYDTLMASSYDEISTEYGLVAEEMLIGPNYSYVKFRLRPEARWHDGKPITPEDVIWSFEKLTSLSPQQRFYYSHVVGAEITGENEVTFRFDEEGNRELPHIVGQLLILPKHWWTGTDAKGEKRDISRVTLEPPLGSGAYKIGEFSPGKFMILDRVDDYWGKDLAINIGSNNFEQLRYEYFRDNTVMFEAFKSDAYDFRVENTARVWAKSYDFPAIEDGRVIKEEFPDRASGVTIGFFPNMRREKFKDPRVRQALNYLFNFEEMNRTLFFNQYKRAGSYFFGTEFAASGKPDAAELALLEPLKDQVPAIVFEELPDQPKVESREDIRSNLKKALELFKEAGWEPKTEIDKSKMPTGLAGFWHSITSTLGLSSDPTRSVMRNEKGEAFEIEYLVSTPSFERIALRLQASMERVGIKMTIRVVDSAQYVNRLRNRDYDFIYGGFAQSLSLGNEQKGYFGSASADREGSRNFGGIKNPAVDKLVDAIIFADNRKSLVTAARALDRVLQANHYMVPGWTNDMTRTARWNRFGHPKDLPILTVGFPTIWWWDEAKAKSIEAKQ
ncbi:extracellular solute-binding protein [Cohaesibacter gelatinilyticus]|uniref:Microcin C transport system substrate-binding protein n=1 Tax=Cohaesibacter gelatinilyticus TaxID=372072 RepID=A0A285PHK6_9HYPH|nr:extracellular solute-binding protein [Cohaesibacter gelatinilyticus]SNZ20727.1 microcin C transport system substrate-binding protein [Cohaesibacter gelatinilyticus]